MASTSQTPGGANTAVAGVTISDSDRAAVAGVPQRIVAAWAENDADAFAGVFAEDATLILPGNVYLQGRDDIRRYMTGAFMGPYKGTQVFGKPLDARFLGKDAAVVVTEGGVLLPGETEVAPERQIRATWTLTRRDGAWLIAAYQNTPTGN